MRRALLLVLTVFVLGLAYYASRIRVGADASALLLQAAERSHEICYVGTVRTTVDYGARSMTADSRVSHSAKGQRIDYVSVPVRGSVTLTHSGEVRRYHPGRDRTVISGPAAVKESLDKTRLLLRNYRARLTGEDSVAGRKALVVRITPRHRGNPSKTLWIDRATYLPLASEDRTSHGDLRSRMRFLSVSYAACPTSQGPEAPAQTGHEMAPAVSREKLSRVVGFPVTLPGYVPRGYVPDGYRSYGCRHGCKHVSAVIRYTDGLNSISVFEVAKDAVCATGCCARTGSCKVGYCRQASYGSVEVGPKAVIVVADLPKHEIEKITNSVK